ncbi:TRAP transporter small permease subunit [Polynucleobacter antarcticus]|uniref:TRAP transporter small permease protein n=1 Tax=Polynucleobacter antarcticus TaxID=1743162 RepID=A0A6M9PU11_9BURK|nr:TRAP transporter small permease subunit [Polynucleobacter antarcticus]QKM63332.1 C4-dicarboxylate ABC transporter permease [Polynucleobacter antarcticus]
MQQLLTKIAVRIEGLIDFTGKATSYVALAIVGLIAVNVFLRYTMSVGSVWAQELEWHLLAALILFGMSYALLRGDNVRVDLFYGNYSPKSKYRVDILSAVLTIIVALLFIYLSFFYVMQSYSIGEMSPDPGGIPYRWIVKGLIPIGFILLALQGLAELCRVILNRPEVGGKHV